jgi:hypothetical protein
VAQGITEIFDHVADRVAADVGDLERGRIMHSDGLKTRGKFCAFTREGEVVLKLPAERVKELIDGGAGAPFDAGKGRPMREWVRVRPADERECTDYVLEAQRFVASEAKA